MNTHKHPNIDTMRTEESIQDQPPNASWFRKRIIPKHQSKFELNPPNHLVL